MANIDNYAVINIVVKDAAPGIPNFGELLLVAQSVSGQAGTHLIGASPAGLEAYADDYAGDVDDIGYKMLSQIVRQEVHVPEVLWYNPKNTLTDLTTITPLGPFDEGKIYKLRINGSEISHKCGTSETAATVATALELLADALTNVTAVDLTGSFSLAGENATDVVYLSDVSPRQFTLTVTDTSAEDMGDVLAAAFAINPNFYGVLLDVQDAASIGKAAAWAETNKKLLVVRVKDSANLSSGVLSTLHALGYHRTAVAFSSDDESRLDAAILGRFLATTPGSSSPQFKTHPGTFPEDLSDSQFSALQARNAITYTSTLGVAFTDGGKAVSGRPILMTRNIDYMQANLEQAALAVFLNTEIVSLDGVGLTLMETALKGVLARMERMRIIAPGWVLNTPPASEITPALKAASTFPDFTFEAEAILGASKVRVFGTVK